MSFQNNSFHKERETRLAHKPMHCIPCRCHARACETAVPCLYKRLPVLSDSCCMIRSWLVRLGQCNLVWTAVTTTQTQLIHSTWLQDTLSQCSCHWLQPKRRLSAGDLRNLWLSQGVRLQLTRSRCHGKFVAASTKTCASDCARPSIWMRNSVLVRREASCSPSAPRLPIRASISSRKTVEGAW